MHDLCALAVASLAFLAIPGPSVFYIVTRSLTQGRRAGVTSMLGVQAGGLVHVIAAAIGVSALIASSATAFTIVKYAGAAYLVYLGVKRLLSAGAREPAPEMDERRTMTRLFLQGVIVNVLNPKTALFFLLPQFVDRTPGPCSRDVSSHRSWASAFSATGTYSVVAAGSGGCYAPPRRRDSADRVSGGVFIGLGLVAALAGEPRRA